MKSVKWATARQAAHAVPGMRVVEVGERSTPDALRQSYDLPRVQAKTLRG
jgi:hypothetical protein